MGKGSSQANYEKLMTAKANDQYRDYKKTEIPLIWNFRFLFY